MLLRIVSAWVSCLLCCNAVLAVEGKKPNVLFIAVDDLRPELGCYGQSMMKTPNIDRLASQGIVFDRAYCNVPVCGASRASLMTGLRPTATRFLTYTTWAEQDAPGITPLHTHFKQHGYYTISNGKVLHQREDHANGWSEAVWRPRGTGFYVLPENIRLNLSRGKKDGRQRGPATEAADRPDEKYDDYETATKSIADLRKLAKQDEPFFLAVGFYKPHLPFVAPQKYWDLYDPAKITLPQVKGRPQDAPPQAMHTSGELRAYSDIPPMGPLDEETARRLIHGYFACISFTDAQIGRLLNELEKLGLADDTIVVLWGDHGWNLGEHGMWCKHCCFETSMRVPLIVKAPQVGGGKKTAGLTEFVDIYPSLCELAGLPLPEHLHGRSFAPLLKNPELPWKPEAIGRFGLGDTIRTATHRFTEYTQPTGKFIANMLYDHTTDPHESVNLSPRKEQAELVSQLTQRLHAGKGRAAPAITADKARP
jgi:iduronate 2-sulfatase